MWVSHRITYLFQTSIVSLILFVLFACMKSNAQSKLFKDTLVYVHFNTDTLFNSQQSISYIELPFNNNSYYIKPSFLTSELITTSQFGKKKNAVAAINGGFFNRDQGGSVSYCEWHDTVLSHIKSPGTKWAKPDSLLNAAMVLKPDSSLQLEPAKAEAAYEISYQ